MNVNNMFPSKYLKGADLKAPVTVTIASVRTEKIYKPGTGMVDGFILYCEKAQKGVILSRPLALGIAQALSEPEADKWTGRQITLYPQAMTVVGVERVAIRARAAVNEKGA